MSKLMQTFVRSSLDGFAQVCLDFEARRRERALLVLTKKVL